MFTPFGAMARTSATTSCSRVVDDVVGPGACREVRLGRVAHGRDDRGVAPPGELDRCVADGSGTSGHQDGATFQRSGAQPRRVRPRSRSGSGVRSGTGHRGWHQDRTMRHREANTTWRAGTTAYSCAVPPAGRRCAASQIQTRRSSSAASTPWPTASTTPEPSWFGTCGGCTAAPLSLPRRDFQSVGLTPERWTRTRTSPGPGSGSGRSTRVRTSGSPVTEYSIARMCSTLSRDAQPATRCQSGRRG